MLKVILMYELLYCYTVIRPYINMFIWVVVLLFGSLYNLTKVHDNQPLQLRRQERAHIAPYFFTFDNQ